MTRHESGEPSSTTAMAALFSVSGMAAAAGVDRQHEGMGDQQHRQQIAPEAAQLLAPRM